jgi:excisionase family DNA binding protein
MSERQRTHERRAATPGRAAACPRQRDEPARANYSPPRRAAGNAWQPTAAPTQLTADDVMTAREVAGLLHAPVSTVEDWARRGILPSVKIGRRRLYIRQQIEAVLFEQLVQGQE